MIWSTIDDILHGRARIAERTGRTFTVTALGLTCFFGGIFGAGIGSFGAVRPMQMIFSAIKFPMLLLLSMILTIPSFYVFNTLLGMQKDFRWSMRALLATQTGMTLFLAAFMPFIILLYASGISYASARMFNIILLAGCAWYGWVMLGRFYRPLIARNPMHAYLVRLWIIQFVFVMIQLSWVLRPFIGKPSRPTEFLRDEAWGNAYLEIGGLVYRSITG